MQVAYGQGADFHVIFGHESLVAPASGKVDLRTSGGWSAFLQ